MLKLKWLDVEPRLTLKGLGLLFLNRVGEGITLGFPAKHRSEAVAVVFVGNGVTGGELVFSAQVGQLLEHEVLVADADIELFILGRLGEHLALVWQCID